jgi:hypothetical protein
MLAAHEAWEFHGLLSILFCSLEQVLSSTWNSGEREHIGRKGNRETLEIRLACKGARQDDYTLVALCTQLPSEWYLADQTSGS